MGPTASLLRASSNAGRPTLGICFGHQLLCHALGATIERADSLSSGIWDLDLTNNGSNDELLTSHVSDGSCVAGLFTHKDHVMTVPESCSLLCSTSHNGVTAVRVHADNGDALPAWGIQFHPVSTELTDGGISPKRNTPPSRANMMAQRYCLHLLESSANIKHSLRPKGAGIVDSD